MNSFLYTFMRFREYFQQNNSKKAVLVATGGFAPIHRGHLDMFAESKQWLESQGYQVVAGYISPKHRDYVAGKADTQDMLDVDRRIALIQKAIQDTGMTWIKVFDWEARQPEPHDKADTIRQIKQIHPDAEIMYLCGEDNCQLPSYPGLKPGPGFTWLSTQRHGFSSSRVRRAIQNRDEKELQQLLHPGVQQHLLSRGETRPVQTDL